MSYFLKKAGIRTIFDYDIDPETAQECSTSVEKYGNDVRNTWSVDVTMLETLFTQLSHYKLVTNTDDNSTYITVGKDSKTLAEWIDDLLEDIVFVLTESDYEKNLNDELDETLKTYMDCYHSTTDDYGNIVHFIDHIDSPHVVFYLTRLRAVEDDKIRTAADMWVKWSIIAPYVWW